MKRVLLLVFGMLLSGNIFGQTNVFDGANIILNAPPNGGSLAQRYSSDYYIFIETNGTTEPSTSVIACNGEASTALEA
jgi:hypothetical protein